MKSMIKLTGFKPAEKALAELPKATGQSVLTRVGKRALEPMRAKAESLAPVDQGELKKSIAISKRRTRRVKKDAEPKRGVALAMGPSSGKGVLNYAALEEFGTVNAPAQPFMRPAWDSEAEPALETIKAELWDEIDKSAKRHARKQAKD